ncbi:IPT/TIG domain-containing protein [Actinoplanes sp. HUAS TT8]|uniref:IPT/TIG domain-containing protein n=1 Tax=Actinoplanes sp. HUAS TT8 TaxID=3447453 RepID=UPI003F51D117
MAVAAFGAVTGPAYAATTPSHGLGLDAPTVARISAAAGLAHAAKVGVLGVGQVPESVDLSSNAVPAGDQGPIGSCVAWSEGYTLAGWLSNSQRHAGTPFAPLYLYNQINGGRDAGSTTTAAWAVLANQGIAEAAYWTHGTTDFRSQPTTAERSNAANHKFGTSQYLFVGANQGDSARTVIQQALANGTPVELGIPVYKAFNYLSPENSTFTAADVSGKSLGGHAVVILGYNATGVQIENSWGTRWGADGWATLSWDFITKYATEASVTTGFVSAGQQLPPTVTGLSATTVNSLGGSSLTITGARLSSMDVDAAGAVTFVSVADSAVTVPATVTGHTATSLTVTVPAVPTPGSYRVVLTGPGGAGLPVAGRDTITMVTAYPITVPDGTVARTTGGTKIVVTSSGFGTTQAQFTANKVTASINGKTTGLTWIDDTHASVIMPAGTAGTSANLIVLRSGIAAPAITIPYLAPVPVITAVKTAKVSTDGGAAVTLNVTGMATIAPSTTTVTMVNIADPTITTDAPITARTTTGVTVTIPAAPTAGGAPVTGAYRFVITGSGGASVPNAAADQITFVSPMSIAVTPGQTVLTTGGPVTLTGTGFGASRAEFSTKKITATVGGKPAAVAWVNDSTLTLTMPPAAAGSTPAIALLHDTVAGPSISGVTYVYPAPVVTAVKASKVSTDGGTSAVVTVTGADTIAPETTTVALVAVADPSIVLSADITARTKTSITITTPSAPAQGAYRIVVTGRGGPSVANRTADQITYRQPYTVSAGVTTVAKTGGKLTLTGSGFTASSALFAKEAVTALVNGRPAAVTWVNESTVTVQIPAGAAGSAITVVLNHDTVAGAPLSLTYAAA